MGCCDEEEISLFPEGDGECRYWKGKRCELMCNPELREELSPQEDRLFTYHCLNWPIPQATISIHRTFTDEDRLATGIQFGENCCYRWVHA